MAAEILQPGMLTTIQDLGRSGHRSQGVVLSGAADGFAHRISNWLVGNDERQATLEITMGGLEILFHQATIVALSGYGIQAFLNNSSIDCWRSIRVRANDRLKTVYIGHGSRSYLAVAGGWQVPMVLGSFSTYASAGWGGFEGRALRKGDVLAFSNPAFTKKINTSFSIAPAGLPAYSSSPAIRIIKGPEWHWCTNESQHQFLNTTHAVLPQSNRMGYRLNARMLRSYGGELLSTAVSPGTLQVLPDGNLVLMMNDAPATGGYPRLAQVIEADLCLCAQLIPTNKIQFVAIGPDEAEEIYVSYHQQLHQLKQSIFQRLYAN